jgi:O-antigen/teichoic acid export membrane protein
MTLRRRLLQFLYSRLARASALLFTSTLAGGLLGYAFQVIMGRMLTTADYGLFSALMALFMVFVTPLAALMLVISRRVSEYRALLEPGSITHFYASINLRAAVVGAAVIAVCLLFAGHIQAYLKAPSVIPVYFLGALVFLTFLPVINDAFLQGLQSFAWLSASSTLRVLFKILFCSALVALGFGVTGALGGTILASVAGWAVTYWALHRPLAEGRGKPHGTRHLHLRPAVPILAASVAFALMTQLDMVLVNYYFEPHDAGLYAAASIIGKAVMYLPSGIAMALFPMVAENDARDQSSAHLLVQAVGLTAMLAAAGTVFYLVLGEWIIGVLYGPDYLGAGQILKYFGFAMFPMALVMVAEYFLMAKGKVLFAYLSALIAPLQVLAMSVWHGSLQTVVLIMGSSGLLLAVVGYAILWRAFRQPNR